MSARHPVAVLALCVVGLAPAADPPATGSLPAGAVARLGSARLRHAAPASCVTFSPDGKSVVSGGEDGAVRLWDVSTGEQKAVALRPDRSVVSVQYTHGGSRIAANYLDGYVRFFDPTTLRQTSVVLAPTVGRFVFSADSRLVATRNPDGDVVVDEFDARLPKLRLPDSGWPAFHPGGKLVAAADAKGVVTVYQLTGGKPVFTAKHGGPVNALAFDPKGELLATAGSGPNAAVKLWQVGKAEPVAEIAGATGPVQFVGNDRLAAVTPSGVGVYDLPRKEWRRVIPGAAGAFAVSPDGTKLAATAHGSIRVRLWDLTTGEQLHATDDAVPDPAFLAPTADGRSVFVVAADKAFVWTVGERVPAPAGTFAGPVATAAAGGNRLAVATPSGVAIWDDFDPSRPLPPKAAREVEKGGVKALALSADGKRLALAGDDRKIVLADAETGKALRTLPVDVAAFAVASTPRGDRLVILGRDGFLRAWDLSAGDAGDREAWKLRVQRGQRGTVAVSPDGKRVAASSSARMYLVDTASGEEQFSLDRVGEDGPFHAAAFTPDGWLLVTGTGGQTGAVQVWELATRTMLRRNSTGLGSVNRLAIFPDGKRAASAGADDAVTVWDLTRK